MPRIPIGTSVPQSERTQTLVYSDRRSLPMTGADQALARRPEVVGWLAKVYRELKTKSREWPVFNERALGLFLERAGVDLASSVKSAESALPAPDAVAQPAACIDGLRGASFLTQPVDRVCMFVKTRNDNVERR